MTEEEKAKLIAEGKLDENGNPIEPANDGKDPVKTPKGDDDAPKFTQAQLDAIISDRLARAEAKRKQEKEEAEAEAERKRLEDSQEYKGLAEQYKQELEKLKEDAQKAEKLSKKTSLLAKAGYKPEQVERYAKFVDGETDDEMQAAVNQLVADVPPTPGYVDPKGAGNSQRQTPAPKDKEEKGRSYFQRLKEQGKIRK